MKVDEQGEISKLSVFLFVHISVEETSNSKGINHKYDRGSQGLVGTLISKEWKA